MLSRTLCLLLIWVFAAASPLRALAVVGLAGCGEAGSTESSHAMHHGDHGDHGGEAHDGHHAAGTTTGYAEMPVHEGGHAHGGAQAQDPQPLKCSSCAPCCAAAAPAPARLQVPPLPPATAGVAFFAAPYVGIVADVPHRPPRSILA